jgi:hypothetical protein
VIVDRQATVDWNYLRIFRARRGAFADLLRLSRHQRAMIEADDYAGLLSILGDKQRLLGQLEELGRAFPGLPERWRRDRDALDAAGRADCEQLLAETESLLAILTTEERECGDELTRRRDQTRLELQGLASATTASNGYRDSAAPADNRHLNLQE